MEGLEDTGHILVEIDDFSSNGSDQLGLITRQVVQTLYAFCMLNLSRSQYRATSHSLRSHQLVTELSMHQGRTRAVIKASGNETKELDPKP